MIPITITEFVKQTVEANPDINAETLIASCKEAIKAKHYKWYRGETSRNFMIVIEKYLEV